MSAHTSGRSTRCPTHSVPYLIRESGSINGGVVIWGCIICVTEQRDALTEANARMRQDLRVAREVLSAVIGDIEDGFSLGDMRAKYLATLLGARDGMDAALKVTP